MSEEKNYKVEIYQQKDFFENKDKIDEIMSEVYAVNKSLYFENKGCVGKDNKVNSTFFYTSFKDAKLYVLKDLANDKIISIAICAQSADKMYWVINYITTTIPYQNKGFATKTMVELAKDLQKCGVRTLHDNISIYNTVALNLYNSFSKTHYVQTEREISNAEKVKYEFDITRINDLTNDEEDGLLL